MTRGRLTLNKQKGHLSHSVQKDRLYKKRVMSLQSLPTTPDTEIPVVVSVRSTPPSTPTSLRTFTIESCLDAACAGETLGQLSLNEGLNGSTPCLTRITEAGRSQDYTNPAYEPDDSKSRDLDQTKRSWSMVLRQVIEQQDDDDLHPYGRGGIYHNIIYGRNVKVKYDYNKMFIWIMLIGCLVLGAGAIIFASEMSIHYRNNPLYGSDTDNATSDFSTETTPTG